MDRNLSGSYARQKLWEALRCLVDEGPLRARLTHTIVPLYQLTAIGSLTDPLASKVKSICSELDKTPAMIGEHYLPRSHLSPKRAKQMAQEILDLYIDASGGL
jgi:hypothetical protein